MERLWSIWHGGAIGFNYEAIKQLSKDFERISVESVIYEEDEQKIKVSELIELSILYVEE